MRVAVLTLTRDRLAYTRHCFASLHIHAGCRFDHYVLDQGSQDGTVDWLELNTRCKVTALPENVGICRGLNMLLDSVCDPHRYDVIVRFDNDCDVGMYGTLRGVAKLAGRYEQITAPTVLGLQSPPPVIRHSALGGRPFDETTHLGGIFMAVPATLFTVHGYRYDENRPVWGGDEDICPWWRARGGRCGYLPDWQVSHYETTAGQRARYPDYFARKDREYVGC